MKKFLALLLALLMVLSLIPAFAEGAALQQDVIILFTSDVHCGIESGFSYAGVAALRDAYKNAGYHVLLVDNGDAVQGDVIGTLTRGEASIEIMNAVGYDIATIGNHEFDFGLDRFFELTEMANFPYISANFNKEGQAVLPASIIKEFDGVKIAFVGASTPTTITTSTPIYFMNENGELIYDFCPDDNGQQFYSAIQTAVDNVRAEGADYVVVMAHLGNEAESEPYTYADLISHTHGIDAVLDGHSHDTDKVEMLDAEGKTVLRQACGTKLQGVGYLKITTAGKLETGLFLWPFSDFNAAELFSIDNNITQTIERINENVDAIRLQEVATLPIELTISDPVEKNANGTSIRRIRSAETNMGDFCADAYRTVTGADIAFLNGGTIRTTLSAGTVTVADLLKLFPFNSELAVCEATGQEILDALEWSVCSLPGEFGGFLQVSGLTFDVDVSIPTPTVADGSGMLVEIKGDRRVSNVYVNGEPIDPEKTYTVASNSYILKNYGNGYTMFADNVYSVNGGVVDYDVLKTYLVSLTADDLIARYSDLYGDGRINIK